MGGEDLDGGEAAEVAPVRSVVDGGEGGAVVREALEGG